MFITVDNHEAVKVGHLGEENAVEESGEADVTTDFLEAVVRRGADELTLRAEEEGILRTFPPFVTEDSHAICQAIFQGVEGLEWETMYCNY